MASTEAFRKLGLDAEVVTPQQAYADPVFYEFEVGLTSPENFRDRIRQILNNPVISDDQIDDAWCAMLLHFPDHRLQLLKKLRKDFRLLLFSNTNTIHIQRFHGEFRETHGMEFPSLFDDIFYSHEIHARKPDVSAYLKILELSGIRPEETLFVDDLEKNIKGASEAGMSTLWLKNGMEITDLF